MNTQKYLGENMVQAVKSKVEAKQDKLVDSGESQNIKTVNGGSILGTGDMTIPTTEFEVLPVSQDPGEGSPLASNKILFIVED